MPFTRLNNVEQFWRGGRDGWNTFIRQLREKRYSLKIQFDSTIYTIKEESNKEVGEGDKGEEEEKDDKKGMIKRKRKIKKEFFPRSIFFIGLSRRAFQNKYWKQKYRIIFVYYFSWHR